ncbi:MAG: TraR/DksA C4-type zinc finger protein [Candidatus Dormiibacterota bacterium]
MCEDCGTTIPTERLHFKPEATRCVACQSHCVGVRARVGDCD